MERLIVEIPPDTIVVKKASCPNGHSLLDPTTLLGSEPSIHLVARQEGISEHIYLNARYGNHEVIAGSRFSVGSLATLHCPECDVSLEQPGEECLLCGAPMISLHLPRRGLAQACSRVGCHFHRLRLHDPDARLAAFLFGED